MPRRWSALRSNAGSSSSSGGVVGTIRAGKALLQLATAFNMPNRDASSEEEDSFTTGTKPKRRSRFSFNMPKMSKPTGSGGGKLAKMLGRASLDPEKAKAAAIAAAEAEHKARTQGKFNVPTAPQKQNTFKQPDHLEQVDKAIHVASSAKKAKKFTRETTLGRIMKEKWVDEGTLNEQPAAANEDSIHKPLPVIPKKSSRFGAAFRLVSVRKSNRGTGSSAQFDDMSARRSDRSLDEDSEMSTMHSPQAALRHATGTLNLGARKRPLAGAHPVYPYEALVFKGGGAKGSIYPGAIRALEDYNILPYIKRFAGASAGACVAALLAIGLTAKQLFRELESTDLFAMIKDGDSTVTSTIHLVNRYGMNPGAALYRYLGLIFYKYLGNADVTFRQLYDSFGVELAICVTNVTRCSSEFLHVKTSPNYPIRKAVRMSMSLPFIIEPCKEINVHGLIHEETQHAEWHAERASLRRQMIGAMHAQRQKHGHTHHNVLGSSAKKHNGKAGVDAHGHMLEYYVDGGVLNNYPIDAFDGWWLSMKPEHAFNRMLIGTGGHANYLKRFEGYNRSVLGFRLTAAAEPDGMQSRLGNDKLELKIRSMEAAALPSTHKASEYRKQREAFDKDAKSRVKMHHDLKVSMDWLKALYALWEEHHAAEGHELIDAITRCDGDLLAIIRQLSPPEELIHVLGLESDEDLAARLDEVYRAQIRGKSSLHEQYNGGSKHPDPKTKRLLDELSMVLFEIEKMCESLGQHLMESLVGCDPAGCPSLEKFLMRTLDAIQGTADERVQTKENMRRTVFLDTEYVGVLDFKLDERDFDFLWRKGYATTVHWLEKRIDKQKEYAERDKKKQAEGIMPSRLPANPHLMADLAQRMSDRMSDRMSSDDTELASPSYTHEPRWVTDATAGSGGSPKVSKAWGVAAAWAMTAKKQKEKEDGYVEATRNDHSDSVAELRLQLDGARAKCQELEKQLQEARRTPHRPAGDAPANRSPRTKGLPQMRRAGSENPSRQDIFLAQARFLEGQEEGLGLSARNDEEDDGEAALISPYPNGRPMPGSMPEVDSTPKLRPSSLRLSSFLSSEESEGVVRVDSGKPDFGVLGGVAGLVATGVNSLGKSLKDLGEHAASPMGRMQSASMVGRTSFNGTMAMSPNTPVSPADSYPAGARDRAASPPNVEKGLVAQMVRSLSSFSQDYYDQNNESSEIGAHVSDRSL